MYKIFLGKGWQFPVALDDDGALEVAAYEESVRQSIWVILGTAKGERLMRPDFGCGIYDMVFEVNSSTTASGVAEEVRDALLSFEPRIDVLDVEVTPGGDNGEVLYVSIDYQVRATNTVFNLVYPFYLESSAAS
ncbi:MAG TPA: GPW/gp25 family protein [Pyrinomonadaceae bacterium]|nr:GPW/gp25 family protein [Pyrinomonadaceae bacterium]